MRRSFALLLLFTCVGAGANAPIREVTSLAAKHARHAGTWFFQGLHLLGWTGTIEGVYAPDGQPVFISPPNGTAQAFAADTDGTLAVAWTSESGGGINVHNASGHLVRTIPTGRYRPKHLTFAEDHSLWSLGSQTAADNSHIPDRSDYMMVRRFLPNGQPAGRIPSPPPIPQWSRTGRTILAIQLHVGLSQRHWSMGRFRRDREEHGVGGTRPKWKPDRALET